MNKKNNVNDMKFTVVFSNGNVSQSDNLSSLVKRCMHHIAHDKIMYNEVVTILECKATNIPKPCIKEINESETMFLNVEDFDHFISTQPHLFNNEYLQGYTEEVKEEMKQWKHSKDDDAVTIWEENNELCFEW